MLSITQTSDVALVRQVLSHPDIFPRISNDFVSQPEDMQVETFMADECNIVYAMYDSDILIGVMVCKYLSELAYETHINVLPGHRGEKALDAADLCIRHLFSSTSAQRLLTWVPSGHENVEAFLKNIGATQISTRDQVDTLHGQSRSFKYYQLTLHEWIAHDSVYWNLGQAFERSARLKSDAERLAHCSSDYSILGFAMSAAHCGELDKAESVYNEFAALCGIPPISIISNRYSDNLFTINIKCLEDTRKTLTAHFMKDLMISSLNTHK